MADNVAQSETTTAVAPDAGTTQTPDNTAPAPTDAAGPSETSAPGGTLSTDAAPSAADSALAIDGAPSLELPPTLEQAPGPLDPQGWIDASWRAYDLLSAGGPVVGVLAALSVITVTIVLAKMLQFMWLRPDARGLAALVDLYRSGDGQQALALAERRRGVDAASVQAALSGLLAGRPNAQVRMEARRLAAADLDAMGGWLRPLEVIAAAAPLLGLLGTVLGMIEAFAALEKAGSNVDPSILSGGIWKALLTTAVGLAVALPAVVAFNWFERRIERAESRIQNALSGFFAAAPAGR